MINYNNHLIKLVSLYLNFLKTITQNYCYNSIPQNSVLTIVLDLIVYNSLSINKT